MCCGPATLLVTARRHSLPWHATPACHAVANVTPPHVSPLPFAHQIHGGTNFGFWAGANVDGERYLPHITSYDYDAPISGGYAFQLGGCGHGCVHLYGDLVAVRTPALRNIASICERLGVLSCVSVAPPQRRAITASPASAATASTT